MSDLLPTLELDWFDGVQVVRIHQHLTLSEVEQLVASFMAARSARRMCVINVPINAERENVAHIVRLIEMDASQPFRLAFVCADDANFGIARMVEAAIQAAHCEVRAFRDEGAGLAWLTEAGTAPSAASY